MVRHLATPALIIFHAPTLEKVPLQLWRPLDYLMAKGKAEPILPSRVYIWLPGVFWELNNKKAGFNLLSLGSYKCDMSPCEIDGIPSHQTLFISCMFCSGNLTQIDMYLS